MRTVVGLAVLLAGCGSSWDIRKGDSLPFGCVLANYYQDADGDGWGDPNGESDQLCSADVERGLTANNGRDCDDADDSIRGEVGGYCPGDLVTVEGGGDADFGGAVFAEIEFAWVYGMNTPVTSAQDATTNCTGWGGVAQVDGAAIDAGHLATFASAAERDEVQQAIAAAVISDGGVYAGFVGIEWDSDDPQNGNWVWVDDAPSDFITSGFSWCSAEPLPEDFFPLLNPEDIDHAAAIRDQLPSLRLAMVLQDSGEWCLGLPDDAIPDDVYADLQAGTADLGDPAIEAMARYSPGSAHLMCSRLAPDPDDYVHYIDE